MKRGGWGVLVLMLGCGGGAQPEGLPPILSISWPTTNQEVVLTGPMTVEFVVSDLGSQPDVQVVERTDGVSCDQQSAPYNAAYPARATSGEVALGLCASGVDGPHRTTLELRHKDGTLFTCDGMCPEGISAVVPYVTASLGPLLIGGPQEGETLLPNALTFASGHIGVALPYDISGFTVAPHCAGAAPCGHILELTDGAACNPVNGAPYNNVFVDSTRPVAWLDLCQNGIVGPHTTTLELTNDDDTLYTCGGTCPGGISASVTYSVSAPGVSPSTFPFASGESTTFTFRNTTPGPVRPFVNTGAPPFAVTGTNTCGDGILQSGSDCTFGVELGYQSWFCGASVLTVNDSASQDVVGWAVLDGPTCQGH